MSNFYIYCCVSRLSNLSLCITQRCFYNVCLHDFECILLSEVCKYNKIGLKSDFGTHFLKGRLAHVSLNPENDWKIYPDLPISWN